MTDATETRDDDIVRCLAASDSDGLAELLRRSGAQILALLRQRFRGVLREEDLEDILSIGLFRLWKNRARYDAARASLRVWYFRICENAARDVLRLGWQRARLREVTGDELIADRSVRSDGSRHPDEPSEPRSQLHADLKELLSDLPDVQRAIVLADASARDDVACSQRLADELGIPSSTVRVYRKRAMDRLRRELMERGHTPVAFSGTALAAGCDSRAT